MAFTLWQTLVIAILVLFLGRGLNMAVPFFRNFNIPEPVTGGFLASLIFGLLYVVFGFEAIFFLDGRNNLLLVFYSTIGLSSQFSTLRAGGVPLIILLASASFFLLVQNSVGVGVAELTGIDPLYGVVGGSITLTGGHGTAFAWATILEGKFGLKNAAEVGAACATFGLILGGLVGGPVARKLIEKNVLKPSSNQHITIGSRFGEEHEPIDSHGVLRNLLMIAAVIVGGTELTKLFESWGFFLPTYVTCLFLGLILANTVPYIFKGMTSPADCKSLALISDISLGLFLSMSLMSMRLWELIDLALPMLLILALQVTVLVVFSYFLLFRLLGSDYDSAVMSSGYMGMALGATPNAIANMTAVTKHYGPSPKAFLVVPLVGAFFIDIVNSVVIQLFLNWVG